MNRDTSHLDYYRGNETYVAHQLDLPPSNYQKYIEAFQRVPGLRVLDVGCGVGQVVAALAARGFDAHGVDVNSAAIQRARGHAGTYYLVDSEVLPFEDGSFDGVGCFTVLEHTPDPGLMLREMIRVTRAGGHIIVACPNFLRVMGVQAHHWHTRGWRRKLANFVLLSRKLWWAWVDPRRVRFLAMTPAPLDKPFEADDDAIWAISAPDVEAALRDDTRIIYRSGSAFVYPWGIVNRIAELPVVRLLIGAVFIIAVKREEH